MSNVPFVIVGIMRIVLARKIEELKTTFFIGFSNWFRFSILSSQPIKACKGTGVKIIYIDMDDTLCDYTGAFRKKRVERNFPQSKVGFFTSLEPIVGAVDSVKRLIASDKYDPYILTAPSTRNPESYKEKRIWIEMYFGYEFTKKLIIHPNKGLALGDILIDDRASGKGQENFKGQLVQFGSPEYPDWNAVNLFLHGK